MIVDILNARKDDGEENAIAYAEKLLNSCKNDSVKKSKNYVYNHFHHITQMLAPLTFSDERIFITDC